jgi:hypothetical protein
MVEVAAMKFAYPNGMDMNQVINVDGVTSVDTTVGEEVESITRVDEEGDLNTGKLKCETG